MTDNQNEEIIEYPQLRGSKMQRLWLLILVRKYVNAKRIGTLQLHQKTL